MQLSIEEFRDAVELLGDAGGAEAAIIAQLVLDLAVSARFNNDGESLGNERRSQAAETADRTASRCGLSNEQYYSLTRRPDSLPSVLNRTRVG